MTASSEPIHPEQIGSATHGPGDEPHGCGETTKRDAPTVPSGRGSGKVPISGVELIFDVDCPNVGAAREQLRRAFALTGMAPVWREWEHNDPACPPYAHGYGSPTILVDGLDVTGAVPSGAVCCRVYDGEGGRYQGAPPVQAIVEALRRTILSEV